MSQRIEKLFNLRRDKGKAPHKPVLLSIPYGLPSVDGLPAVAGNDSGGGTYIQVKVLIIHQNK